VNDLDDLVHIFAQNAIERLALTRIPFASAVNAVSSRAPMADESNIIEARA
jgi:hypothetical protein